jgi:aryl-alcohol dehydrogenase-like predicted oxidoreductase
VHHIDAVQLEYSPFALDIESPSIGILETCRELGIAVVAYDFEEDDFRKHVPRFNNENFPKNLKLVDSLQEISRKKGCTSGQLSLAWLLGQGEDIIPIP